jgi:hypothetical protein
MAVGNEHLAFLVSHSTFRSIYTSMDTDLTINMAMNDLDLMRSCSSHGDTNTSTSSYSSDQWGMSISNHSFDDDDVMTRNKFYSIKDINDICIVEKPNYYRRRHHSFSCHVDFDTEKFMQIRCEDLDGHKSFDFSDFFQ